MFRRAGEAGGGGRAGRRAGSGGKRTPAQYGLFDMADPMEEGGDSDLSDTDSELEAELAAMSGGGHDKPKPKPRPAVPTSNLEAMIAASLKDIPSDDEVSGDEDDPDLLNELQDLAIEDDVPLEAVPTPPPRSSRPAPPPPGSAAGGMVGLLQERIANYTLAEKNAKSSGESSRARRFTRGLKTLNDLLKQAKAGKPVKDDDIPPIVSTGTATPLEPTSRPAPASTIEPPSPVEPASPEAPTSPAEETPVENLVDISAPEAESPRSPQTPTVPSANEAVLPMDPQRQEGLNLLLQRQQQFKLAAVSAKRAGDLSTALEHMKMVKQFDLVIGAYRGGQDMDLDELPSPPVPGVARPEPRKEEESNQQASAAPSDTVSEGGLITASSVDEALRQRLGVFKEQEAKAKEQGNSSKSRRMGRIVKQYEDAIRMHSAGRPIPGDELPTPPGYAPLPAGGGSQQPPAAPKREAPSVPAPPAPAPAPRPAPPRPAASTAGTTATTRADKQLVFLLQRQKEFKEAALNAKKEGEIALAKEYLRNAKGFDSVIDAARGGLIVDLNSLPLPPQAKQQLEDTFDLISADDCDVSEEGDVISRLQEQLNTQLKLCLATRDHNKAMGNVAETNRFEHLADSVKQDLDVVKLAKRTGADLPKFHYEMRQFSVIQCNTDLNDNDLEFTIVRGITYNVPNAKDVDTYVKFEFPFPQEQPVQDRTALVKDTNSPEYNAVFPISINRTSRACLRVFKRHGVKLEVYSRGGFFSRDSLLGTATVKLQPLETQTTIHEAFPLMDGRKLAGGSIEVKLRIRNPLLGKQIEHKNHKWLVIDH